MCGSSFGQFPGQLSPADSLARIDSLRRAGVLPPDSSFFNRQFAPLDSAGQARLDSLRALGDTLRVDTTRHWVAYLDSTARMEEFVHVRRDVPESEFFPNPNYSLYLDPNPLVYKRSLEIDTSGSTVTIKELVNDVPVKVPVTLSLDDFIRQRRQEEVRNNWRQLVRPYTMRENRDELGGLLGNFTNISIPVPANPLFSIFGPNRINLRISGGVDIKGAFKSESSDQQTISQLDRSHSEPNFNQDVQINVNGTIGDKLNILADWNTQRTFEYENQLKIKYTGYDDEIVQSVEAGNVSLQTPSLIGGGQALFGIKARMQMGPLNLTTLLSQKKGQTKELTVSGGATTSEFNVLPQNYSTNHFFLDTLYRGYYETIHQSVTPTYNPEIIRDQVIALDVYRSLITSAQQNPNAVTASAYIKLPPRTGQAYNPADIAALPTTVAGQFEQGYFEKLTQGKDYTLDAYGGVINLNTSFSDEQVIAVAYTTAGGSSFGGRAAGDTTNLLKLIKPKYLTNNSTYHPAWDLMLKNIYPLHLTNVKRQGFDVKAFRRLDAGADDPNLAGVPLLQVLGLDRFKEDNSVGTDSKFDFFPGVTIDVDHGEIIFPTLRPFDSTIAQYFRPTTPANSPQWPVIDSALYGKVYDTTAFFVQNDVAKNRYYLKVSASGSQSSRFPLGFNVVEGSVQVLYNGAPLTPNVDYTVDYIVGEVVIRKPEALLPGANVQVKYEQNDLFQLASKTLLGARAELDLFPNTKLGFTAMNLNQATLSDKVRLNEEPTNNLIVGTDFSSGFDLPFLTSMVDALPFLRTKEMSSIKFNGEAAMMLPDANSKKSTVIGDDNLSIAYIDDFEGARRTIPLPISYAAWSLASSPLYTYMGRGATPQERNDAKAELIWYNILPTDVRTQDIWPNRDTRTGQNQVTVLNLDFDPNHRGMYNYSLHLDSTLHRETNPTYGPTTDPSGDLARTHNWNGVMRYIGASAGSLLEQNIAYLELWVRATPKDPNDYRKGRLFVDLGRISEAVIPPVPGKTTPILYSEDLVKTADNPAGIPNGVRNPGEDVGLDMLDDAGEAADPVIRAFLDSPGNAGDPDVSKGDPSGDDWAPYVNNTTNPYADLRHFNGTENNGNDPSGLLPNTEDLNGNGVLDADDQYLEYELPLDTIGNPFHVGGQNGWYQYRIPLLEAARTLPDSTIPTSSILQNVQYIRLWLSGFASQVEVRIAEMDLVGNQWLERTQGDTVMKVSVVNIEDNPDYNRDWQQLGISREKDRTDPSQIIQANEQSLSLIFTGLGADSTREAVKTFAARPLDLFNYKSMKMFVHGDPSFKYLGLDNYDADVYLRFGNDSLNYYEYSAPIHPGWDVALNQMNIVFSQITALKSGRPDSMISRVTSGPVTGGPPGSRYSVRGSPSLRGVREISIGVHNRSGIPLTGQVWVNELRVLDVDNSRGVAYRFDSQVKLADFGNVGVTMSQTDPSFHALDQQFGNQTTTRNWAVNASAGLEKFFPPSWQGTTIGVAYSHTEQIVKPRYLPNSDIVVTEAASLAAVGAGRDAHATPQSVAAAQDAVITSSQTLIVQNSYAVPNFHLAFPTQAWYIRDTFNKLSFAFNYNNARQRDPVIFERYSWLWNLRVNYQVNLPTDYVQPFKSLFAGLPLLDQYKEWKLYYLPILNVSTGAGGQRSRSVELARALGSTTRESRLFNASKSFGFGWKGTEGGLLNLSGDYGLSIDRNLIYLDNDTSGRGFLSLMKSLFLGGRDGRYGQRVTINTHPNLPDVFSIPRYLDVSGGYGVNYGWQNTFLNGDIGKSAGWDNSINMTLAFRLKALTDPWFESANEPQQAPPPPQPPPQKSPSDTTKGGKALPPPQQEKGGGTKDLFKQLKTLARVFIKIPFLDYDNINITFAQTNQNGNGGVVGSTGFKNFWGRLPFQSSLPDNGPSRLYQLGLISDPNGTLQYAPVSHFPWVGWRVIPGPRPTDGILADRFSETNTLGLRTNRPLWTGATLEINWKVSWSYSKNMSSHDSSGTRIFAPEQTAGSIERSFLTLPPVLFFKVFKSNLEDVGKKYEAIHPDPADPAAQRAALAESFEKGMEALPFLNKIFGQYMPRPNWTLRWDGVEKVLGIQTIVDRMTLEHSYLSSFRRDYRGYPVPGDVSLQREQTDVERVTYGFSPLAGINASFKEILKGTMTGQFRYSSTTAYDLNLATNDLNITETATREISLSLTYSRKGFSFPLFGLNLSNDMDVSFTFSLSKNSHKRFQVDQLSTLQDGIPLDGSTRTDLEPRIRYVLSTRVTAALYYHYSKTAPDEGGALIFGTTTNEAGVDIHISI